MYKLLNSRKIKSCLGVLVVLTLLFSAIYSFNAASLNSRAVLQDNIQASNISNNTEYYFPSIKGIIESFGNLKTKVSETYEDIKNMDYSDLAMPIFVSLFQNLFDSLLTSGVASIMDFILDAATPTSSDFYYLTGVYVGSSGSFTNQQGSNSYLHEIRSLLFTTNPLLLSFTAIGSLLNLLLFVFSFMFMLAGSAGDNKNEMGPLFIRLIIGQILVVIIRPSLAFFNNICSNFINSLGVDTDTFAETPDTAWADTIVSFALSFFVFVFSICVVIEMFKLILDFIERFVVVHLLQMASPAAAGLYVSKTTSNIFVNFMRMYLSQLFLLYMNRVCIYLSCVVLVRGIFKSSSFLYAAMSLAFLRGSQRLDSHLKAMGLSVGATGGRLATSMVAGIAALGYGLASAKRGAGTVGAVMSNAGINKGNVGMAMTGQKLMGLSSGRPVTDATAFNRIVQGGILSNIGPDDAINQSAKTAHLMAAFARGDQNTLRQVHGSNATDLVKSIVANSGSAEQLSRMGITPNSIKNATIDQNGNIIGTYEAMKNGQTATMGFSLGLQPKPNSHYEALTGFADGTQRYISTYSTSDSQSALQGRWTLSQGDIASGLPSDMAAMFGTDRTGLMQFEGSIQEAAAVDADITGGASRDCTLFRDGNMVYATFGEMDEYGVLNAPVVAGWNMDTGANFYTNAKTPFMYDNIDNLVSSPELNTAIASQIGTRDFTYTDRSFAYDSVADRSYVEIASGQKTYTVDINKTSLEDIYSGSKARTFEPGGGNSTTTVKVTEKRQSPYEAVDTAGRGNNNRGNNRG